MTYHWARWVVAANGEVSIGYSIEVIIRSTLSPIAKHANRTLAVVVTNFMVDAILRSLTVVLVGRAWVSQDAVRRASLHIAIITWSTHKTSLRDRGSDREVESRENERGGLVNNVYVSSIRESDHSQCRDGDNMLIIYEMAQSF